MWCGMILLLNQMQIFKLPRYWCGVFLLIPILVGITRLGLGYHWLSDVVASYALCATIFLATWYIYARVTLLRG